MSHDAHHDDWFRHSSDEALPQEEHASHVNTTAIGLTLLAIVFGVLFTIVILSMYFVQYANTRKAEMNEGVGSADAYLAYRDKSETALGTLGWVDRTAGTVNVPMDDAMRSVVDAYSEPGVRASTPWQGGNHAQQTRHGAGHDSLTHADGHPGELPETDQEDARSDG